MIVSHLGDLGPSRTHKTRYYQLVGPAGEWRFRVEIVLGKRSRDVYFLDEFPDPDLKDGYRAVYFSRQTGQETADRPSLYRVVIDPHGLPVHCSCSGSTFRRQEPADPPNDPAEVPEGPLSCKHKDVIRDMLANDLLPVAEEVPT